MCVRIHSLHALHVVQDLGSGLPPESILRFRIRETILQLQGFQIHAFQPTAHTVSTMLFFLWRSGPTCAITSTFMRFLDHTRHTALDRTPLDEWPARHTDLSLATHNSHKTQTYITSAGLNPQSQHASWPQAQSLKSATTGAGIDHAKPAANVRRLTFADIKYTRF